LNAETATYLPWIVMIGIVLISLVWKGYIKLPGFGATRCFAPPDATRPTISPNAVYARTSEYGIPNYSSHELGVAFAKAKRKEAELELDTNFAKTAGDALKASYTAPFSQAAPGPAASTNPGV
jgi:hypothetical protein